MSGIIILISVLVVTILIGRHAIAEGQRHERNKKFMENLNNFDMKNSKRTK